MESEARSGRPSTSRNEEVIEEVHQIVMEDRRLTLENCEYPPENQTINKEYHLEISRRLRDAGRRK